MPVENLWLVENRVMLTRLSGHVTIDDLAENARQGTAMIESGIAPVYSLVDTSQMESFPLKLNDLKTVYDQGSDDKLGWILIYGIPNRFVSFLATTLLQLMRKNYKVVNTQEEAMTFVNSLETQPFSMES
jgi:hypothetical protein